MGNMDGSTCQKGFVKGVNKLGVAAQAIRVVDAKAVKSVRAGKRPADYYFFYKQFGSLIECKETMAKEFKFSSILEHQMARAKRCLAGGSHYIFPILSGKTMAMYLLHISYLIHHQQKVRRSYITWEELSRWEVPIWDGTPDFSLLVEMVTTPVAELDASFAAKFGILNNINNLEDSFGVG